MKVNTATIRKKNADDDNLFISAPDEVLEEGRVSSDGESEGEDERAHKNLLSAITKISSKRKLKAAPRDVRISTKNVASSVNTDDILKLIGIKELEAEKVKLEPLKDPLEKIHLKRAKRSEGYEEVVSKSSKWTGLVHRRRVEDQLQFPLQMPNITVHHALKTEEVRMKTPLEQKVYAVLQGAKLMKEKEETAEEKKRKRAMSLAELKERNNMVWKLKKEKIRIERKAWMQNKSKSRKYHRILRRERLRKEKAELEELMAKDPEAACEKLDMLEKARVEERVTLRHKQSKWAHLQGMRAMRDEQAKTALKENLDIHKELLEKRKLEEEESSEDEDTIKKKIDDLRKERQDAIQAGMFDPSNPWTANLIQQIPERIELTPTGAIDDSFVNFKKFWDEVNKRKLIEKQAREAVEKNMEKKENVEDEDSNSEGEAMVDEDMEKNVEDEEKDVEEDLGTEDKDMDVKDQLNEDNEDVGDVSQKKTLKTKKQKVGQKNKVSKLKNSKNKKKEADKSREKTEGLTDEDEQKEGSKSNKLKKKKVKEGNKEVINKSSGEEKAVKTKDSESKKKKKKTKAKSKMGKKDTNGCEKKSSDGGLTKDINNEQEKKSEDLEEQLVLIDNMFNQAELGLQRKLKRKLEKLGVGNGSEEWTKVESKKKRKVKTKGDGSPAEGKEKSILPKIEAFDFMTKKDNENIEEGLQRVRTLEDIETLQNNEMKADAVDKAIKILKADGGDNKASTDSSKNKPPKSAQVDPAKFLQVDAKVLQAVMPDTITRGTDALDDDDEEEEEDAEDIIQQAFADDYLVDEFNLQKKEAIEKDNPKSVSLVLPGWGAWTGPNIKVSKRKRQKFTIKAPPAPPRKDANLGNVIYNEKADMHTNLRKSLVSDLPYPFARVQDFEASVRAPIGRMYVPEKQHQKLTLPPVVTKPGTIIDPMTESELLKDQDELLINGKKHGNNTKNKRKRNKGLTPAANKKKSKKETD